MGDAAGTGEHKIELADMIETLRQELEAAQLKGAQRPVSFGVEKVELELKVALSAKDKVGGGIKFWVVSADAAAERSRETLHTFKVTLLPLDSETKKRLEVASNNVAAVDKSK